MQLSEGWLTGEDALLWRGVKRFGKQQDKIQQYFLPWISNMFSGQ